MKKLKKTSYIEKLSIKWTKLLYNICRTIIEVIYYTTNKALIEKYYSEYSLPKNIICIISPNIIKKVGYQILKNILEK